MKIRNNSSRAVLSVFLVWSIVLSGAVNAQGSSDEQKGIIDKIVRGKNAAAETTNLKDKLALRGFVPATESGIETRQLIQAGNGLVLVLNRFQNPSAQLKAASVQMDQVRAAYDTLRAAVALMDIRFSSDEKKLLQGAVGDEYLQRHKAFVAERMRPYRQAIELLDPFFGPDQSGKQANPSLGKGVIETVLALFPPNTSERPEAPILRANAVPFGGLSLPPRMPRLTPAIVPSYARNANSPIDPSDVAEGPGVVINDEVVAKARELHNDYVLIYQFVRNSVKTEWYSGSVKGSLGTLRTLSGNDVDQASLLAALLRAAGAPARFVSGVVELPVEYLADELGIGDPSKVPLALAQAGVASTSVTRGGRVAAVQVERTWIAAYVPYANYRGAVVDASGKTWIPLDPAYKLNENQASSGIYAQLGGALILNQEFLATDSGGDFLSSLTRKLSALAHQNGLAEALDGHLGNHAIKPLLLNILPNSLPYAVIATRREDAQLDPTEIVSLRIVVRQGNLASDKELLSTDVPIGDAATSRLTLSYIPASLEDHRVVLLWGGLDNVPLYLIGLRPQIKLDGKVLAVGLDKADPGSLLRLELTITGPFGSQHVDSSVVAGAYHALIATSSPSRSATTSAGDTEFLAARLLDGVGLSYVQRWAASEQVLAYLTDVGVFHPVPAVTLVTNDYRPQLVDGKPVSLAWQGVSIDAALWPTEAIGANSADFLSLSALQGSSLEHVIFEEQFGEPSVSADRGLALARDAGIPIVTVTSSVPASLRSGDLPSTVLDYVDSLARQGFTVEIPEKQIDFKDWHGAVWRAIHPTTHQAGYFISGGLAGGQTGASTWSLDFLADALKASNSEPADQDPKNVANLAVIGASTGQEGTVGKLLPIQLAVKATNKNGVPVQGASVVFQLSAGDATFGETGTKIAVLTNQLGIASVPVTFGTSTYVNSRYAFRHASDQFPTQIGYVVIDAATAGANGLVRADAPFEALAYPDVFSQLRRKNVDSAGGVSYAATWADSPQIGAEDQYKNPVPNVAVNFTLSTTPGCSPSDTGAFRPGAICKNDATGLVLGDCGGATLSDTSSTTGNVGVRVFASNDVRASHLLRADSNGVAWSAQYQNAGSCGDGQSANYYAGLITSIPETGPDGRSIAAALPGGTYKGTFKTAIVRTEWAYRIVDNKVEFLPYVNLVPADGTFTASAPGASVFSHSSGYGNYDSTVVVGSSPGEYPLSANVQNIPVTVLYNTSAGYKTRQDNLSAQGAMGSVYAVNPTISGFESQGVEAGLDSSHVYLDTSNTSVYPLLTHYAIAPTGYNALATTVNVYENGSLIDVSTGDKLSGSGSAYLPRNTEFKPANSYEAEVVLNPGGTSEIRSAKKVIPTRQGVIQSVADLTTVQRSVDLVNKRVCETSKTFGFALLRDASVTLTYQMLDTQGTPLGTPQVLLSNQSYSAGSHDFPIDAGKLGSGVFLLTLDAVASDNGDEEKATSMLKVDLSLHNALPVGQTLIRGVNARNGVLTVQTARIGLPGRGPSVGFGLTYSSTVTENVTTVGAKWQHNYDLGIQIDNCGIATVSAGDSGSVSFYPIPGGTFAPEKGYHGTLIANKSDNSFDFYSKDGTRYHYAFQNANVQWKIGTVTDPSGNQLKFEYDMGAYPRPRLTKVSSSDGRSLVFKYSPQPIERAFVKKAGDVDYLLTEVSGTGDIGASLEYDKYGNLTAFTANGRRQSFEYAVTDSQFANRFRMLKAIDANGNATTYTYKSTTLGLTSDAGESISLLHPYVDSLTTSLGQRYDFAIDETAWLKSVVTSGQNTTSYEFNQYGSPTRIEDAAGTTLMSWATDDILMTSKTDARGVVTNYEYDSAGNQTLERVGSIASHYSYAQQAQPPFIKTLLMSKEDRNGNVSSFSYDDAGRLTRELHPEGVIISHVYGTNGDRLQTIDGRTNATRFEYDAFGNLEVTTLPTGARIETPRDLRGRVRASTDGKGQRTSYSYDTQDNLITRTDPLGKVRKFAYDAVGNKTSEQDERGIKTTWAYNAANQILSTTRGAATKTFGYDEIGNKSSETDWRGNITTFGYDKVNRLVDRTEPLGKHTGYEYDGVGNLTKETDALSHVTSHSYDSLGRRTETIDAAGKTWKTSYDGNGNVLTSTDPRGATTSYNYDGLNRKIDVNQPLGRHTVFTYDFNGNKLTETDPNGKQTKYAYDAGNRVVKKTDPLGGEKTFEYDLADNLLRQIDEKGNITQYEYDALNRKALVKDPENKPTAYGYDAVGNLISETWPNGNALGHDYDDFNRRIASHDTIGSLGAWEYDSDGNLLRETDANGNVTTHSYNALSQRIASVLPGGRNTSATYDLLGNRLSTRDARGHETSYAYDALNRLKTVTQADGGILSDDYDDVGNKVAETDARNNKTVYAYDPLNRLERVTDPLGKSIAYGYDLVGNKTSETNKRGVATTYLYDELNRLTQVTKAGLTIEQRTYDAVGNLETQADANGNTTRFAYDKRSLLTLTTAPLGAVTRQVRDDMGDVAASIDPEGRTNHSEFDLRRRVTSQTNAANETTRFEYDLNGNRTAETRPKGGRTVFGYDVRNVLVQVKDPLSNTTAYEYDENLNLQSILDARGNSLSYGYDVMNHRASITYPGGASEHFDYDKAGNLLSHTDANALVITRSFDVLNREELRTYSSSADGLSGVATQYDANNNVISVTEQRASGNLSSGFVFDDFDRMTQHTDPYGAKVAYTYDPNGNRLSLVTQDGRATHYGYDALNRLTSVGGPGGNVVDTYDKSGLLLQRDHGNGIGTRYGRDSVGRTTEITHAKSSAVLNRTEYAYDANGNRTLERITRPAGVQRTNYTYDDADRLSDTDVADLAATTVTHWDYDAVGNRIGESVTRTPAGGSATATTRSYSYDARNELTHIEQTGADGNVSTELVYDAQGNQTQKTRGGVVTRFDYDAQDQLIAVSRDGTTLGRYRNNYLGLRIEKEAKDPLNPGAPPASLRILWDGTAALQDRDAGGQVQARYEFDGRAPIGLWHVQDGVQSLQSDALGSVVLTADANGNIKAETLFDAWGVTLAKAGASANKFGYTGHQMDDESGLIYAQARYYDPETGRFLTQDPVDGRPGTPLSYNSYLYAYGNPTLYIDPDGNKSVFGDATKQLENFKDWLGERNKEGNSRLAAVAIGTAQFVTTLGEGITRPLDVVANLAQVATGVDDQQVRDELQGTKDVISGAANFVVNGDYIQAAKDVRQAAVNQTVKALEGDVNATANLTQLVLAVATARGSSTAGRVAGRIGATSAEFGEEVSGAALGRVDNAINKVAARTTQQATERLTQESTKLGVGSRATPALQQTARAGGSAATEEAATQAAVRSAEPVAANSAGAPRITLQQRTANHNAHLDDIAGQLREQGYTVKGNGARFYDSTGQNYTHTDLFAIRPNGEPIIIEMKTGGAVNTTRQNQIYPQILTGDALPSRPVARMLGIKPNVPLNQQGYTNGIPIYQVKAPGL